MGRTLIGTALANGSLKWLFARARPEVLTDPLTTYSMPSGHSSAAFAFFLVLGVLAGWALASIPGALLGGLLGQVLDRRLKLNSWASLRALFWSPRLDDDELLFMLLGRLAKCGGRVLQVHIHAARQEMQRLRLGETARQRAMEAFGFPSG